jgi:hypothetical protein
VYNRVVRLMGRDPDTASMTDAQKDSIVDRINSSVREGWEYAPWPEFVQVERRAFRSVWSATQSYTVGNEVYYSAGDAYYVCIQAAASGEVPPDEALYWTEIDLADLDMYLPYEPDGTYPLGEVLGVYQDHPDQVARAREYVTQITNVGIQVQDCGLTRVYVKYRFRPSLFTLTEETGSEALGDIVYRAADGECYQAQLNGAGDPVFVKLDMPYVLSQWVAYAAFSDMLIEDGQYEKYMMMRSKADAELERAYVVNFGQQGISERVRWEVHV